ncbi:recombination protein NinG [Enterobacter asburiae]|uniref:recombination protein NinG n=1 Tax=Enterobacter cloacae complex TaxID=354276 RepID=UPI0025A1CC35|nr:recombination protein NinG [Enterobacter asburiae]MDM6883754.1 recombination protein NinG [Enterobacter asburiae]MDM7072679.1 recombination protein NinG [Enterobacter asburiae]HBK4821650.1 recombination protein NinG [Enterobacter asburiae]HBK4830538.1 recombination protein NinG [Enterobacter asburiae]HDS9625646.1 recombination protein NinG [Enterobacter asburiae]
MRKPPRRKCTVCREWFHPVRSEQYVCSYECACVHGKAANDAAKAEKQRKEKKHRLEEERADRQRRAERRMAVKPLSYFIKQAQHAFNEFIRYRDRDLPCISCGRHHDGQYHAGHFRTTGASPELRFDEDNCHKQCSACNNHISGNLTAYRPALIAKIGQARFDALMGPHALPKWTRDDYIRIRDEYRAKLRDLKKQEAA